MTNKILDIENRKKIYEYIKSNPGLNLSEISKNLDMIVPLVDYHTLYLEMHDLIVIDKGGGFKRYYIKGETGAKDKKFLGVLRQDIPLKIVLFLLDHPHSKHKEILENFDIAASTLTYHINKLIKNEIVFQEMDVDRRGYEITDKKELVRFLIKYRPSKTLNRFKETWTDFDII